MNNMLNKNNMKKLLTICLLIVTTFNVNAQEKFAVDSITHFKQFHLGDDYEKHKREISKVKDTDYYEYKTNDVLIAFGETVETVYLNFNNNGGKLIGISLEYKKISKEKIELIKTQYVLINNELTQKLGSNYKKDDERPGLAIWKGNKIQLNYELNKYVDERALLKKGEYKVLGVFSSITISLL